VERYLYSPIRLYVVELMDSENVVSFNSCRDEIIQEIIFDDQNEDISRNNARYK
jgi:hypothetical protein